LDSDVGHDIYFVCKHILRPNRLKSFERNARKAVSEMGVDDDTLSFQMYFSTDPGDDGPDTDKSTRCHLIEHYQDSAAHRLT